jgi:ABC-type polysaccharide/polyol phosphate export permease
MPDRPANTLLWALVTRNLKMRYQRSALGVVWAFLNPALTIVCLIVVFRFVLRIRIEDYWAFLLSGYFAWVFFVHTVAASTTLLRDHGHMLRSVSFPPDVLLWSTAIARCLEFLIELTLVAGVLAVLRHHTVPWSYGLLPLAVGIQLLLTLAIAFPVAALGVFFHDVQHALPVAMTILSYISPVFYTLTLVPEGLRVWFLLFNPFTRVLPLFHALLYEGRIPGPGDWLLAATLSASLCVVGMAAFRWRRPVFAEVV